MMSEIEEPTVTPTLEPWDTALLRKMMNPVCDRNIKHTALGDNSSRVAFLDSLIKECLIEPQVLDALVTFGDRYREYLAGTASPTDTATAGTTPGPTPPSGEPAVAVVSTNAATLATYSIEMLMEQASAMAHEDLVAAAQLPADGIDLFDAEQRHIIDEIVAGRQVADVFEVIWDGKTKPGEIMEHDTMQVKVLGFALDAGKVRVTKVDADTRRAE